MCTSCMQTLRGESVQVRRKSVNVAAGVTNGVSRFDWTAAKSASLCSGRDMDMRIGVFLMVNNSSSNLFRK